MKFLLILKYVIATIIQIIMFCFGFVILASGIMMFLDLKGIIKSPIDYDGGFYTATMYTLVGLAWSIFVLVIFVKSIKAWINKKS